MDKKKKATTTKKKLYGLQRAHKLPEFRCKCGVGEHIQTFLYTHTYTLNMKDEWISETYILEPSNDFSKLQKVRINIYKTWKDLPASRWKYI